MVSETCPCAHGCPRCIFDHFSIKLLRSYLNRIGNKAFLHFSSHIGLDPSSEFNCHHIRIDQVNSSSLSYLIFFQEKLKGRIPLAEMEGITKSGSTEGKALLKITGLSHPLTLICHSKVDAADWHTALTKGKRVQSDDQIITPKEIMYLSNCHLCKQWNDLPFVGAKETKE